MQVRRNFSEILPSPPLPGPPSGSLIWGLNGAQESAGLMTPEPCRRFRLKFCSQMLASGASIPNPACVISVSVAWGSGPQSCQLSPAGLLSGQHFSSAGLPLGE